MNIEKNEQYLTIDTIIFMHSVSWLALVYTSITYYLNHLLVSGFLFDIDPSTRKELPIQISLMPASKD